MFRQQKGISLIEALLALGLLVIFLSGSAVLSFRHLDNSNRVIDLEEVRVIAEQSMEAIQSMAYENWDQLADGYYGLDDVGGSWSLVGSPDLVKDYTRTIIVTPVERDDDCLIVDSGGEEDDDTKYVTVSIAWTSAMGAQLREFSQYFTNWKNPTGCVHPVYFYAIHGNGNINLQNSNGVVNGDINAGGSVNTGSVVLNGIETSSSSIAIPTVDFASYLGDADHYVSGNYQFPAGVHTGIWYIDGNATINSGVTINGTVVATGNIRMVNSSSVSINPTRPYPALLSQGNIEGNNASSVAINGIALALGNVVISSSSAISVYGSLLADGNVELKNSSAISVTYDELIADEPPPYIE